MADRGTLIEKYGEPTRVTNGIVIRIYKDTAALPSITSAIWLLTWIGGDTGNEVSHAPSLRAKIIRTAAKASKLRNNALVKFQEEEFALPTTRLSPIPVLAVAVAVLSPPVVHVEVSPSPGPSFSSPSLSNPLGRPKSVNTPEKRRNDRKREELKKDRRIAALEGKLRRMKASFQELQNAQQQQNENARKGHCSMKNVKRREERSRKMRMALRMAKNRADTRAKVCADENVLLKRELEEVKRRQMESMRKQKKRLMEQNIRLQRLRQRRARRGVGVGVEQDELVDERRVVDTKMKDGEFKDGVRFCVMELVALEVATGKVETVMETVGALCGVKFSALPRRSACQRMVDEGHVLAKRFINEKILKKSRSFGVHKDGTSRRKVKILDTSINTNEGEVYCLGWSSVVSETGQAIAEDTKDKLGEVVGTSDECMLEIARKLNYCMNDRAANEKKSTNLLEKWKKETLGSNLEDSQGVRRLYCAAHVLLGFHSYTVNSFKKLEFLSSPESKHPCLVMLKDAADLFGPVGDYRGLRDQWEAFCTQKGIKSCIKSYKDNRFNGLFEVAAQLFHHHQDFIDILECQPTRNFKQNRLLTSLKNPNYILLNECLGLFFHLITGPFWNMVISSTTTHQTFKIIIKKLKISLQKCIDDPDNFLNPESFSFLNFPATSPETRKIFTTMDGEKRKAVMTAIANGFLATMQAQLIDVLEDERMDDTEIDTVQAPLTNLICERNFGYLDSSQKRRPHGSLHHHSSVILLKQTRKKMRQWYDELDLEEKGVLWRRARVESKDLRRKHQERDKKAIMDSLLKLKTNPVPEYAQVDLKEAQMVAVACEDAWYPALVEGGGSSVGQQDVTVNFAVLGKTLGSFYWPTGKDVHTVSRKSVVETCVEYEPRAGGRHWAIKNARAIQAKFKKFK